MSERKLHICGLLISNGAAWYVAVLVRVFKVTTILLALAPVALGAAYLVRGQGGLRPVEPGVSFLCVVTALAWGAAAVMRSSQHKLLDWLAAARREAGLCVRCGYDLTGIISKKCPECGEARRHEGEHCTP